MPRLIAAVLVLVVLALGAASAGAQDQPRMGGVFKAAMIGEPPTLDLHTTTAVIVQQITWHVYEGLYTYDKSYNAVPLLVDSHAVGDSGRTYTFKLRRGVKFHNGKELTAADVVRLAQALGQLATPGKQFWRNVEGVEAKDPYTVAMYLKEPSGALLMGLARPNSGAVIYPKEIMDAAGDNQIKEFIGTGPYRFVEHKPDRHVGWPASRSTPRGPTRPRASAASAPRTSTRSCSSRCRTWPCGWPGWRRASTTSGSRSSRTSTTG